MHMLTRFASSPKKLKRFPKPQAHSTNWKNELAWCNDVYSSGLDSGGRASALCVGGYVELLQVIPGDRVVDDH